MNSNQTVGLLAQFESEEKLLHACRGVRDKGFKKWDAYSSYPIHGLSKAMGLSQSPLPSIVLSVGLSCGIGAFCLWSWMNAIDYKYVIAGKPFFSWQLYFIPGFEIGVLTAAFTCLFGLFGLCNLPMHSHPIIDHPKFKMMSDGHYLISIDANDPSYDSVSTPRFLNELGALLVEVVEDETI